MYTRELQSERLWPARRRSGPVETLAQSVSAVAPSTSPSLTIPLVFAIAGNATWLVYLLATAAILLVGFCVSRFARSPLRPDRSTPTPPDTLPPVFGVTAAWGLLLAYWRPAHRSRAARSTTPIVLSQQFFHWTPPALAHAGSSSALAAGFIAYRDVKLSAELMLWIEIGSVSLIVLVLAIMPVRFGFHLDLDQFT